MVAVAPSPHSNICLRCSFLQLNNLSPPSLWLLRRRDCRLLFRYSSWLFVENNATSLPSDLSLLFIFILLTIHPPFTKLSTNLIFHAYFSICWHFRLLPIALPQQQAHSHSIFKTHNMIHWTEKCFCFALFVWDWPGGWHYKWALIFELLCPACLAKSVENGKELLVLRGVSCFSESLF